MLNFMLHIFTTTEKRFGESKSIDVSKKVKKKEVIMRCHQISLFSVQNDMVKGRRKAVDRLCLGAPPFPFSAIRESQEGLFQTTVISTT